MPSIPDTAAIQRPRILGYVAIIIVVFVWAGFALSIRAIEKSDLTAADVALIRYGVPALILLPFLRSRWQKLIGAHPGHAAMIIFGAGIPFFFIVSAGGARTSATLVGALVAGTLPFSVALLTLLLERRVPSRGLCLAIGTILLGVAALVGPMLSQRPLAMAEGTILLMAGSLLWALYTLGLRRVGLDAIACALLLCLPCTLMILTLMVAGQVETHLSSLSWKSTTPFLIVQGLGVGLAASLAYPIAISRIGAARSSVIGSLAPAVACLAAIPILGEAMTTLTALGVAAVTAGVIMANKLNQPEIKEKAHA